MAGRIIVVLGVPRSGTSMVAGVLHNLGVNMGTSIKKDNGNPLGYFEDEYFVKLHHEILEIKGGPFIWDKPLNNFVRIPSELKGRYKRLFATRNKQEFWGLKDIALPWTWPLFYELAGGALSVIRITRPRDEVAKKSQERWGGLKKRAFAIWRHTFAGGMPGSMI